ncbi:hypothetical protein QFC21_006803 [Naganishia friedmannii]|uniref:Uncharacterized protein n=1 Tax=Naganishia friedmannii TaxID=89922 RepID=A0ACC2V005_9TREE|nr:hypothetical protein QFC21_006803 [Naganishia friedmannii]
MAIKTSSPWRKTNLKSRVSEWLHSRKTVNPAKIRTSLLFAALQEVLADIRKTVQEKVAPSKARPSDDIEVQSAFEKSLLEELDALSRGSRKLPLRIDAVEQGVKLSQEVIENSLYDWQAAFIKVIRTITAYSNPVRLSPRLRQAKALHRDLYAAMTRILRKRKIAQNITFRDSEEVSGSEIPAGTTAHAALPEKTAQKRRKPTISVLVHANEKEEKDTKHKARRLARRRTGVDTAENAAIKPQKVDQVSPKLSTDTIALLRSFRRPRSRGSINMSLIQRQKFNIRQDSSKNGIANFSNDDRSSQSGRSGRQSSLSRASGSTTASKTTRSKSLSHSSFSERSGSLSLLSVDLLDQSTLSMTNLDKSSLLSMDSAARDTSDSAPTSLPNTPSSIIADR